MRAAQVVRKEIFASSFSFDGSFYANCQQEAVPTSLLAQVNMILEGCMKVTIRTVDADVVVLAVASFSR